MYRIATLLTRRRIIISVISLVILFMIWFVAFHGFIQIKNHRKNTPIHTYQLDSSLNYTSDRSNQAPLFLSSGDYLIQVPMKNNGIYLTTTTAPHFLGNSKTVNTPDFEADTHAVGRRVAPNLAVSKDGLVSWAPNGEVFKVNSSDPVANIDEQPPLSFPNFSKFAEYRYVTQLSKSTLVGIRQISKDKHSPVLYNFLNDEVINFPAITASVFDLSLQSEVNGFSVYDKKKGLATLYNTTSGGLVVKKVNQGDDIAIYDGRPVYSFNTINNRLILATGPEVNSLELNSSDGHTESHSTADHVTLRVFNTKDDSLIATHNLGSAAIKNIIPSADGNYIAITTGNAVGFYTIDTLRQVFAVPYTVSSQAFWTESGDFLFNSGNRGVIKVSPRKKLALSLLPYSVVRPSRLAFVDGNNLYLTGFSAMNDFNKNPDAYRIALSRNVGQVQRKIFRAFPHQGNGFYVDYLDREVVVQLPRYISSQGVSISKSAREEALDYVSSIFGSKRSIKYTYVTTDLRVRDTGED